MPDINCKAGHGVKGFSVYVSLAELNINNTAININISNSPESPPHSRLFLPSQHHRTLPSLASSLPPPPNLLIHSGPAIISFTRLPHRAITHWK